ncbi:MAG: DUF2029 domain-containing protein [Chloroflexi bacterium]|nr:MAG: DUF2029 domain-containing protein [Chloroflexota bacterium]
MRRVTAERRADVAFLIGVFIGVAFIVIAGPLDRRIELVHENDFSGFWAGARALVIGADPYDAATWRDTVRVLGTQEPNTSVYGYVPWVAVALVPLALLPLETAAWIWMVGGVALAAIALRALLRALVPADAVLHFAFGLALLVSQPGFHALVLGQWSFVLLAALCAAVLALRAGRDGTAGMIAALTGLAIVALGWFVLPGWLAAWSADVAPERLSRSASITVALRDVLGSPLGLGVALAFIAAGIAIALRARGRDARLALWSALGVAGAPYLWSYDQLLLLVPLALAAGALADRRAARVVALAGIAALLVLSPLLYALAVARHRESFSAFLPAAMFVGLAVALLRERATEEVERREPGASPALGD